MVPYQVSKLVDGYSEGMIKRQVGNGWWILPKRVSGIGSLIPMGIGYTYMSVLKV